MRAAFKRTGCDIFAATSHEFSVAQADATFEEPNQFVLSGLSPEPEDVEDPFANGGDQQRGFLERIVVSKTGRMDHRGSAAEIEKCTLQRTLDAAKELYQLAAAEFSAMTEQQTE